jgi:hypothetical protein
MSDSVTKQMRKAFAVERTSMVCGKIDHRLITKAIDELETKSLLVAAEMDEWTALDILAYEILKQSAGIQTLKIIRPKSTKP